MNEITCLLSCENSTDKIKIEYRVQKARGKDFIYIVSVNNEEDNNNFIMDKVIFPEKLPRNCNLENADMIPVKVIGKKAFMDLRVKEVILPDTVNEIENWAFFGNKYITELKLPKCMDLDNLVCGKEVFKKMSGLKVIKGGQNIYGEETIEYNTMAKLIAELFTATDNYSILNCRASSLEEWISYYDRILEAYIETSDEEGFSPVLAGGEEDYITNENDINYHCSKRRLIKLRLIFDRIIKGKALGVQYIGKAFTGYIDKYTYKKNMAQGAENKTSEAWDYVVTRVREGSFDEYDYFEADGFIDANLVAEMINGLTENDIELKAKLIKYREKELKNSDDENAAAFSMFDEL